MLLLILIAVASTTRAGLGQSLCIGMGGDTLAGMFYPSHEPHGTIIFTCSPGTNFVDALKAFEQDANTEGIVLIGELGGRAEMDAVEWIKDYNKRVSNPKYV